MNIKIDGLILSTYNKSNNKFNNIKFENFVIYLNSLILKSSTLKIKNKCENKWIDMIIYLSNDILKLIYLTDYSFYFLQLICTIFRIF